MANDRFRLRVKEFLEKTGIDLDLFTKRVAFDIHRRIVLQTPVDTGRARASWNIVVGESPDLSTADHFNNNTEPGSPRRASNMSTATAEALAKQGPLRLASYYIISNNLPYIERLENGWSKQAPYGMVRIAVAEVKAELTELIGRVAGGGDINQ